MAISKLILNGVTQMDVTQDTVTAATLAQGEAAHDASGVQITGTAAGSNTFTLEYQNANGVWSFTPTYADIKAAVQQGKVIEYTSFGDPALGGKYGNGYATNVTFNGTTFTEAVRFYLQDFTFGGVSIVYYGYSGGQLRIQSQLDYIEPQGTLNITTNGTHNVSSYASALVNVSGGGGLTYETGTWIPSENVSRGEVTFTNTHTSPPSIVWIADDYATNGYITEAQSNITFVFVNSKNLGASFPWYQTSATNRDCMISYFYATTLSGSMSSASYGNIIDSPTSSETYAGYYVTNTAFYPYSRSATRTWKTGRSYKWIAIWAPTP